MRFQTKVVGHINKRLKLPSNKISNRRYYIKNILSHIFYTNRKSFIEMLIFGITPTTYNSFIFLFLFKKVMQQAEVVNSFQLVLKFFLFSITPFSSVFYWFEPPHITTSFDKEVSANAKDNAWTAAKEKSRNILEALIS